MSLLLSCFELVMTKLKPILQFSQTYILTGKTPQWLVCGGENIWSIFRQHAEPASLFWADSVHLESEFRFSRCLLKTISKILEYSSCTVQPMKCYTHTKKKKNTRRKMLNKNKCSVYFLYRNLLLSVLAALRLPASEKSLEQPTLGSVYRMGH